jgi:hypothetical protein
MAIERIGKKNHGYGERRKRKGKETRKKKGKRKERKRKGKKKRERESGKKGKHGMKYGGSFGNYINQIIIR